jgi:hypothetical protein
MATGRVPTTANSPLTAKGDLFGYSTTQARVAVGSDGDTLVADSAASTGLRWQPAVQQNPIINSSFQVAQRGTSISVSASTSPYTLDRWQLNVGANCASTVSRQNTSDTTNLPFIQYCARVQRNSGQTGTSGMYFAQTLESSNSVPYAGKTVTFSFYARAGANYSPTSNILIAKLVSGTGTDQNIVSGFTGGVEVIAQNATLTTTWQRFSYTATISSSATQLGCYFQMNPTGTASTNDYFEVTGVQLELGSVATRFQTTGGTLQGELGAAQRYYYRQGGDAIFSRFGQGYATSTVNVSVTLNQPTTMRVAPTAVDFSTLTVGDGVNAYTVTGLTIDQAGKNVTSLNAAVASGLTQFRPYGCGANNSTSAFIGLSAEL